MVRNRFGGSKHKKLARKNETPAQSHIIKTRLKDPNELCEIYAIITKMYGQGNCEALCNDGVKRLCVIRKKFRARNRRNNQVSIGTHVLVGLRDWEVLSKDKRQKCDLLEVYNPRQISDLKRDPQFNSSLLKNADDTTNDTDASRYVFGTDNAIDEEIGTVTNKAQVEDEKQHAVEYFDIDAI